MLGVGAAMLPVAGTVGLGALRRQNRQSVPIPGLEAGEPTVSFALRNVNVIDVLNGRVRPPMTVVIAGNRIQSIELKRTQTGGVSLVYWTRSVKLGKLAELVLLESNPLDSIANTQKINMVMTGGRVYRRAALDATLSRIKPSECVRSPSTGAAT